ncbi:YbaB/EbfC family nucleoid-associated protein [Deinococcus antarcticus]|uniref:Nucleoid-associated protein ACFOPQ_10150 n=1 Tax=Deinococcus antarcticus TaxID=1298767 RepID=A0ABV8A6S8_9DEIO
MGVTMDMKKLMKQMQQAQSAANRIQEELAAQSVEGTASGLVTVVMNGHGKVQSLKIKPEAVDSDDVEALEDLILAAINDAAGKADDLQRDATKGLGIPGF